MPRLKWSLLTLVLCLVVCFSFSCRDDEVPSNGNTPDPGPPSEVEELTVVTWNAEAMFSVSNVNSRSSDLQALASNLEPDILVLQEVTSIGIVDAIRDAMGLDGYFTACSDFNQNDDGEYNALEVAFISKYDYGEVIEYDQTLDNVTSEGDPTEEQLSIPAGLQIENVNVGRGYLWATIPELEIAVAGVHLKSSSGRVGQSDASNAKKRELVASAIAKKVAVEASSNPDYTYIVAGDFNVGHSDPLKVGTDLSSDCYSNCSGQDLYDETHALFGGGLVDGLQMSNLSLAITTSTYPSYPGTPIDNIYSYGPLTSAFGDAFKAGSTYGSDHLPVVATTGEVEDPPFGSQIQLTLKSVWRAGRFVTPQTHTGI